MLEVLLSANYIVSSGIDDFEFTEKFRTAFKEMRNEELQLMVADKTLVKHLLPLDWQLKFMSFIVEARVPVRLEDNKGGMYSANKYSEKAMLIFKKAIESGVDYKMLVRSTQLYYASKTAYKQAIGNYFITGTWKSDYLALSSLGTPEEVINHIKSETDNGNKSQYELG